MTARTLPPHPNLAQLKRQAKELLERWKTDSHAPVSSRQPRLRDAQRGIAAEYGFSSWDALREHVERLAGKASDATAVAPRRGLDYGDPIRDAVLVRGPLTREEAQRLTEQGVSSIGVDESVPPETLRHLAHLTTLRGIDFSNRGDLVDEHVSFLEALPFLMTVSFNGCHQITDAAIAHLRNHHQLERIDLDWTRTGDGALESLAGKPALARVLIGGRTTDKGIARLRDRTAPHIRRTQPCARVR